MKRLKERYIVIMDFLINLLAFIFSLSLIVAVHELGHLIFAKRAKILCFEYSIGMGPLIYKKKGKETDFAIRAIPIGGFVSMAGEGFQDAFLKKGMKIGINLEEGHIKEIVLNPALPYEKALTVEEFDVYGEKDNELFISGYVDSNLERFVVLEDAKYLMTETKTQQISPYNRSFESKKFLPKFLTLIAGPFFNFILAFLLFFIVVSFTGKPQNSNVIGGVMDKSPALKAGLSNGDKITKIGDKDVTNWETLGISIAALENYENVKVEYIKKGETNITTAYVNFRVDVSQLGISNTNKKGEVLINPLGAEIGLVAGNIEDKLQPGDIITHITYKDERVEITSWADIVKFTEKLDGGQAQITYLRGEVSKDVYITVWERQVLKSQGVDAADILIGVSPNYKYDFLYSLTQPFKDVYNSFYQVLMVVGFLFGGSKQIGVGDLSGPVGIFKIVGFYASGGILSLLAFIAFLSVNIGIINLLPIPALDGGRILFISIEAVTRKKIPRKVDAIVNNVFFVLLLLLLLFVTFKDIVRLF
jgi:regulator of sigma E protease